MYYVVGKYRIVVESESPVVMKDYPSCELIEGAPGVDMINFEVYEEDGVKKVRSKEIEELKFTATLEGVEESDDGYYSIKLPSDKIEIKMKVEGKPHIPEVMTLPEGHVEKQIDIRCTRGKLSSNTVVEAGSVWWTPVDETVEVAIMFSVLNFPPLNHAINIRLYT
jgi:hypothetical protein